jgi:hypothetical protein
MQGDESAPLQNVSEVFLNNIDKLRSFGYHKGTVSGMKNGGNLLFEETA